MIDSFDTYIDSYRSLISSPDVKLWNFTAVRTEGIYKSRGDLSSIYFINSNNLFDRNDGPAVLNKKEVSFYKNGDLHREDGPAILFKNGSWSYAQKRVFHRTDGPALYMSDGFPHSPHQKYLWYCKGLGCTNTMTQFCEENGIDVENITEEQKILIRIKMAEFDV